MRATRTPGAPAGVHVVGTEEHLRVGIDHEHTRVATVDHVHHRPVDLVAVAELEWHREPRTGLIEVRSASQSPMGDIAKATMRRAPRSTEEVGEFSPQRSIGVVHTHQTRRHRAMLPARTDELATP
jgi:hypothetical protein